MNDVRFDFEAGTITGSYRGLKEHIKACIENCINIDNYNGIDELVDILKYLVGYQDSECLLCMSMTTKNGIKIKEINDDTVTEKMTVLP